MNLEPLKKFLSLLLTAFGIFIMIAIIYTVILFSRLAMEREHTIKNDYAGEVNPSLPALSPTIAK
jgi:hypothetical protein